MRTIKTALAILIGLVLMLIMAANWRDVELHLLLPALAAGDWKVTVPLAMVIVLAVFAGFVLGLFYEYLREHKHRSRLAQNRAEVARLKAENAKLSKQAGVDPDELSLLAR